ncbi:hypothetical protein [Demequina lignilytica]|uniref:Uncharacterized protein n=1 Tax=Demequina lignilytica TaxID=3051663 RepID=A0AAW7M6G1_9MICO|nr:MULTISPECIES: hypothetical protein [unclassified Demequina]MDN4478859.1 hypothetical protein [Demequina sp. SYSU T00039-1]MDN4484040.1 hypothetical protein [Demequina sp. SYSU T0a273]MDN4488957.1 hypothetical protein [Demequina sp. SYSU T00039]MDN4490375.1 hypothetical protein [Demequina sp. SYSU T00068]
MRTRMKVRSHGGAAVLVKGMGALAGLAAAATLSLAACADPNTAENQAGAGQNVGYVYSGGSWGSTQRLSDTGLVREPMTGGLPAYAVPAPVAEEYEAMPCVPDASCGRDTVGDAVEPMGGMPDYVRESLGDQVDHYEPLGGVPEYAYSSVDE